MFKIDRETLDAAAPFAAAIGLTVVGAVLVKWRPDVLEMPEPNANPRLPDFRDHRDVALQLRESAAALSPRNLMDTLGRSLIISGALLLVVRAIDGLNGEIRK